MNLEKADALKEEANECFKSNRLQQLGILCNNYIFFRLFRAKLRQSHNTLLQCH